MSRLRVGHRDFQSLQTTFEWTSTCVPVWFRGELEVAGVARSSHFVIIGPMKRELVCRCSTFGNLDSQDCIEVETCTPSISECNRKVDGLSPGWPHLWLKYARVSWLLRFSLFSVGPSLAWRRWPRHHSWGNHSSLDSFFASSKNLQIIQTPLSLFRVAFAKFHLGCGLRLAAASPGGLQKMVRCCILWRDTPASPTPCTDSQNMETHKFSESSEGSEKIPRRRKDEDRKRLKRVKEYVLGDVLGEGSYGQVREGLYVPQDSEDNKDASLVVQTLPDKLKFGQRVAVKIIRRRLLTRKVRNGQENLKREIACLKRLKHQNVIQLYDTIDDQSMDKIYLVFELANFLSLQDILALTQKTGNDAFKVISCSNKEIPVHFHSWPP